MAENKYKGFSLFNEVENQTLRTWNRCATVFNINKVHGEAMAKEYLGKIEQPGRSQMMVMFNYINRKGYDVVKREVNKNNQGE